jgi:hypothetical protein
LARASDGDVVVLVRMATTVRLSYRDEDVAAA